MVGVPDIVPAVDMVRPTGSAPELMLHVMGIVPVALSVWLKLLPTVAEVRGVAVLIDGAVAATPTVMLHILETLPAAFATCAVKLYIPVCVGVPETVPVVDNVRPGGRVPKLMLHVKGVVPVAASVWL
jgi:hypothetical protein